MTPRLRTLVKLTLVALAGGFLCVGYAYFVEPDRLVVNNYELKIKNWNPAFNGFRAAVISDVHAGSHCIDAAKLREIVRRTNELNVDAVFMLGDFVSQKREPGPVERRGLRMEPDQIAEGLSGMRSRYGVFMVLGNHDQWYDPAAVRAAFQRTGYRILDNDLAEIALASGQKLRILGLPDHTTIGIWRNYSENAKRVVTPTDGTGDLILLQHAPDAFPAISGEFAVSPDVRLILFGHTHGGQVRLPIIGPPVVPSMYGQKFAAGPAREAGIDTFTTTGIGTSILPLRFLVPPEIAVITIRAEDR